MDGSCTVDPLGSARRAAWALVEVGRNLVNGKLVRKQSVTGLVPAEASVSDGVEGAHNG